jgi:uncharacterized protein YjbI with pentapeptide repeats
MLPRLRESSNENGEGLADTRALIRARTLAILEPLDPWRKGAIMRFLSESGLLEKARPTTINLRDPDFRRSDLKDLNLSNTDLQDVSFTEANLGSANLSEADLRGADLSYADLSRARLGSARLDEADLSAADLSYANLSKATGVLGGAVSCGQGPRRRHHARRAGPQRRQQPQRADFRRVAQAQGPRGGWGEHSGPS